MEVQILSTAPFLSITVIFSHNAVVAERQTHHLEGVAPPRRVGSSPTSRTDNQNAVTAAFFYLTCSIVMLLDC